MVTAYMRDIAIIIIAVQSIVIGALIAVLILQVWRLIKMVQTEIKPMIDDMQDTIGTVRGTTTFVSDNIVQPVAKTSTWHQAPHRQHAGRSPPSCREAGVTRGPGVHH